MHRARGTTTDLHVLMTSLVQDGADILRHEVHAEHSDRLAACLRHLDSPVRHDQGVRNMDVRPSGSGRGQDPLHLRQMPQHAGSAMTMGRLPQTIRQALR